MRIAKYGIVEDIRVRELNLWEIVQIHIRKLVLNRITYIWNSFQVIVSFSQIMFPWQRKNMYTLKKFHGLSQVQPQTEHIICKNQAFYYLELCEKRTWKPRFFVPKFAKYAM